jgi:L-arabinose isomerase
VPEIAGVFNNARIPYDIVTGWLDESSAWEEIEDWCAAVRVSSVLRNSRIGILGHYYCGMLDVYTDVTRLAAVFGCHFEMLEMDKLKALRAAAGKEEIEKKRNDSPRLKGGVSSRNSTRWISPTMWFSGATTVRPMRLLPKENR